MKSAKCPKCGRNIRKKYGYCLVCNPPQEIECKDALQHRVPGSFEQGKRR